MSSNQSEHPVLIVGIRGRSLFSDWSISGPEGDGVRSIDLDLASTHIHCCSSGARPSQDPCVDILDGR